MFWGSTPPAPPFMRGILATHVAFSHCYPPLIYYLTERSLFKKCPPHGKILKKGPDRYRKYTVNNKDQVYNISRYMVYFPDPVKIYVRKPFTQMRSQENYTTQNHKRLPGQSYYQFLICNIAVWSNPTL